MQRLRFFPKVECHRRGLRSRFGARVALLKLAGAARDAVCDNRNSPGRNRDLSANIGCRCMPLLTSAYQPSIRRNACPTARWKASRPRLDVDESTCVHACPSVLGVNETWERAALDTFQLYAAKRASSVVRVQARRGNLRAVPRPASPRLASPRRYFQPCSPL